MKKPNKRETLNLALSAFLILGYIICTYFFLTMAATAPALESYVQVLVFTVFGLVVFYATRIGDGVQVKRLSLGTLFILDLPALYIIIASFVPALPLHNFICNLGGTTSYAYSPILILACVALGYGIPYTFLSGYEEQIGMAEAEEIIGGADFETALGEFESEGELVYYVPCNCDDEGAMLVIDDLDSECDEENEIRQQYAVTAEGVAQVGTYVKLCEVECECTCEDECECECTCGCNNDNTEPTDEAE